MKNPKNLILKSMAEAEGVSIEELTERLDKRKKTVKKKRKKKIKKIDKSPSVELVSDGLAQVIDFSEISGRIYRQKPLEDVFQWNSRDLALYIREKYSQRYAEDWGHSILGAFLTLTTVHDRLLDIIGHCDYLVLRDYIDYLFAYYVDDMKKKHDGFLYLREFGYNKYLLPFCRFYDYVASLKREHALRTQKYNDENKSIVISNEYVEQIYSLSEEEFIKSCGIIVGIFWLIRQKGLSKREATKQIYEICKDVYQKGDFKEVKNATEILSPYPKSIFFPRLEEFVEKIDKQFKIEVEYQDSEVIDSKFIFLKEDE